MATLLLENHCHLFVSWQSHCMLATQRAYEDLLAEGYIETTAGKGSFVAQRSNELVRDEQYRMIEIHLEEATLIAHKCGIKFDKLVELLGLFFDGGN